MQKATWNIRRTCNNLRSWLVKLWKQCLNIIVVIIFEYWGWLYVSRRCIWFIRIVVSFATSQASAAQGTSATQGTATTASAAKTMAPKRMAMSLAELLKSPVAPSVDHLEKWFTKDQKKQLQQNHINMKPNN